MAFTKIAASRSVLYAVDHQGRLWLRQYGRWEHCSVDAVEAPEMIVDVAAAYIGDGDTLNIDHLVYVLTSSGRLLEYQPSAFPSVWCEISPPDGKTGQ